MKVWTQNNITDPTDRKAIVKAVLRGESLTTFEAAISDRMVDDDGKAVALTTGMVNEALAEVTKTIFPHRALEIQKQWMRKSMKKPADLSARTTAAALARINSCLPLFPGGSDTSMFTPEEMVEILECSLPYSWRQKFNFDGYIPTDGARAQFITQHEAIERNEDTSKYFKKDKKDKDQPEKKKVKFQKKAKHKNDSDKL